MNAITNVAFFKRLPGAKLRYHLGSACQRPDGWKFYPNALGRRSSRKPHKTMEACLPRWLGYPDRCESDYTVRNGQVVATIQDLMRA